MHHKKRSGAVWRRFLVSYLLVLLIPVFFFVLAFSSAQTVVTDSAAFYHETMLEQVKTQFEKQVTEARMLAMEIEKDQEISNYLYGLERGEESVYRIWEIQNKLQKYLFLKRIIG